MNMTRKVKREAMKGYNAFKDVLAVIKHYFPDFMELLSLVRDPRHQSYITYSQEELIMISMFARFAQLESRRHMNECFNNENVIHYAQLLFDESLEEIPHGDTINNYFKEVSVDDFRNIMYAMFRDLIRMKIADDYRIENKYYHLIIDGVNMHSYSLKHTDGCLEKHHQTGQVTYHNDALVAVISMGNVTIPVDFEMIENIGTVYNKQDCEINAAKRLLKRIKKNFKRLQICVAGDALYFGEPMIELMNENEWKYIITFKEGSSRETAEYYETCKSGKDTIIHKGKENTYYEYYNGVEYREKKFNIIEIVEEERRFCYITDIEITERNCERIGSHGRNRWKIENKSFNDLKNHGYHLSHAMSYDENAMKIHIMITLISHLIMQLVEHYEKTKQRFVTIRELGEDIKEALRFTPLSAQDIKEIATRFYISRLIPY